MALLCSGVLAASAPLFAHAADGTTPKSKKHVAEATLAPVSPAEQFTAPLQMNFDGIKALILKPDPILPYQPQTQAAKPAAAPPAKGDAPDQPHLAPLLRETSLPDSMGDRGNFMERHEFGIQLHDHF